MLFHCKPLRNAVLNFNKEPEPEVLPKDKKGQKKEKEKVKEKPLPELKQGDPVDMLVEIQDLFR